MNRAFPYQKGLSLVGVIIVLVIVGLITGGLYFYLSNQAPEIPKITEKATKSEGTISPSQEKNEGEIKTRLDLGQDSEKYKNEIQNLLNKQCQAISGKNLGLLISTMDQSNMNLFQEYKQSVEILLAMMDSVIKCQYKIQDIQFYRDAENLVAETTEKGDLEIKLINGSTKMIEGPNVSHAGKYIKIGEEWKQIIQFKN